jgi:hypothetical protein
MAVPGVSFPTTQLNPGSANRGGIDLAGHVFLSSLELPDISKILTIKYPQYYLLSLAEKIAGASVAQGSKVHSWFIQDRTRKGAVATAIAGGTTASATVTTNLTYDVASGNALYGYFLVNDLVRVNDSEENAIVTAIGFTADPGFQTITISRYGGGVWSAALLPTNATIGHIGSAYPEGSLDAGGVRLDMPYEDYNVMQIIRRKLKISSDLLNQKTWIDDKSWYFQQEPLLQKEFMRDTEATIVFGKRFNGATGATNYTRGLMEYAEQNGVQQTFSSAIGVQEADLSNFLKQLYTQNASNDLIVLCGEQFLFDVQHALSDRYRQVPLGEKPAELAGLNFQSYQIAGKRLHFAYYEMFSDAAIVPPSTATSTAKDFRNLALVLDFGITDAGERNIQVRYRTGETGDRKMVQKFITGLASPGAQVSNSFDGMEIQLLSEVMPKVVLPNRLGLIYSNG